MYLNTLATALILANTLTPATAFFRMSCPGRLVRERLDPVISPGAVSGHVHNIAGGSNFGPSMTFQQARDSKCSSCAIQEDLSNYWTPQLYVKYKNGTFAPVPVVADPSDSTGGMTVYYLQRRGSDPKEKLHAFPEGFRMVAGDTFKRNYTGDLAANAISFNCLGANKPETNNIPDYNCPGGLRAQVFFPACWDGKNLDTPDHRSHMSYPVGEEYNLGACPDSHPVHMISLFYEILYDTSPLLSEWNGDQHPFVFANGDPTGYSFHGDFVNGWDVNVLQNAVDNCNADSGLLSDCPAVTQFTMEQSVNCKIGAVVNEKIDGPLSKLPGCNPIVSGPGPASPVTNCPVPAIGAPQTNNIVKSGYEYIGCGIDDPASRVLTGASMSSDDMTIEKCMTFCWDYSGSTYSYIGLEYGRECYCDSAIKPTYAPIPGILGNCGMPCAGNSSEVCGHAFALSIYRRLPLFCPKDDCNNQMNNPTASVSANAFCASYTKTINTNTTAIPTYLFNCQNNPLIVSSACSCFQQPTFTGVSSTATATTKPRRHARDVAHDTPPLIAPFASL